MTSLPWLQPVLKFFFMNILKIAAHGLYMTSMDGTSLSVLNIIFTTKFVSLPPIQFKFYKLSLGLTKNSPYQLPLTLP